MRLVAGPPRTAETMPRCIARMTSGARSGSGALASSQAMMASMMVAGSSPATHLRWLSSGMNGRMACSAVATI